MNAPATDFPAARITPNLAHALGGIWRLTLRRFLTPGHGLALLGGLVAVVLLALASNHEAANDPAGARGFFKWVIEFYLTFLLPVVAFISAGGALRDELKPDSVDYIFTRPVPRPAFVVGKFLAQVACAQVDYLLAFAALVGVGMYRHVPELMAHVPKLLFVQVLLVVVFSAFGFFFAMLTARFVIAGIFYGAVIELGVGAIPTQLSRLSMIHQVRALFPSFTLTLSTAALPPPADLLSFTVLLLVVAAVLLAAAAGIFMLKELAASQVREA